MLLQYYLEQLDYKNMPLFLRKYFECPSLNRLMKVGYFCGMDFASKNIYDFDPFATIDRKGVGKLMKIAVELGRKTRPDLKLGICGEHGGDPSSVEFCHRIGLNYVSCSPYRVPIARLAAAQANIKYPRK